MDLSPRILFEQANAFANGGRLPQAKAAYEKAIELDARFAEAHHRLGQVCAQLGDGAGALRHFLKAYEIDPRLHAAFADFAQLMMHLAERGFGPTIVKDNQAVRDLIAQAKKVWPARIGAADMLNHPAFAETVRNPYMLFYLGALRLRDAEIEQMLVMMRNVVLSLAHAPEVSPDLFAFTCALARQCFGNEYVFALDDAEAAEARALRESVQNDLLQNRPVLAHRLAVLATYFPLSDLEGSQGLLEEKWPSILTDLLTQQVREPEQERAIRKTLPQLTSISDEISLRVRGQYEANPYPRWVTTSSPERRLSFAEYMTAVFPHSRSRCFKDKIEVLFAGCGTGSVVAGFGQLIANAQILAIDLSLSSLSYAKRMAEKYRLNNVQFGQADILKLPELSRKFDVISSTGVMHHMAEPFRAWRVLVSLLNPGGVMHVGFYSEIARQEVSEGWAFIKDHGYGNSADEIRRFRSDVMALPDGTPMRHALTSPDFYSLSDVRDLLFHEHELRVELPQIREFLAEHGLEFIGWEVPAETRQLYRREYPDDPTMVDLANWELFERKFPHTFSQMYKFWVQKAE